MGSPVGHLPEPGLARHRLHARRDGHDGRRGSLPVPDRHQGPDSLQNQPETAWFPGGEPRAIAVSRISELADAHVLYGARTDLERTGRVPGLTSLLHGVWRERGFGDFWGHALVAEGAAEAMIEADLSAWDAAAPLVLVEEAGGRVTDLGGVRTPGGPGYLATNGLLHDELLTRLRAVT